VRQFVIAVRSAQRAMYAPLYSANGGRPRSKHTALTRFT
jgi:hypothetical protein